MNFLVRAVVLLLLSGINVELYAQLIPNPSFEGTPKADAAPSPWTACNTFSTPDTQPGIWRVTQSPSHGTSYLGLVTRGNLGPYANNTEAAQIQLKSNLRAGKSYNLSMDLAFSTTQGHEINWGDFLSYANPTILKIWGGVNSCEKSELLWESPTIDHSDWKTYRLTIVPKLEQINYLILEANYTAQSSYFGNLLIDNIVELNLPEAPSGPCNLATYNVFTPNGDGYNDVFLFQPVSNIARFNLKICNRWGKVIFETTDLAHGWDGKTSGVECETGVYFWYSEFMCIDGNQIYDNKLKGSVTLLK